MCGRFTLRTPLGLLVERFLFEMYEGELTPRFNIAPTQAVAAVRIVEPESPRQLCQLRWGLIPSWAKDRSIGNSLINARGETVAEKPSFRSAFTRRRCLVLADGYYEWQKAVAPAKKQPYYIHLADGGPFAMAGLWEAWRDETGDAIESCTIITTSANADIATIHDRMPVILNEADYAVWLDPNGSDRAVLQELLRPAPADSLAAGPVSTLVNSPRNESPECIRPVPLA
jgi:putative SOS response-associated peptidase YedK